jgi:6-phosphogluconate dehydrogenase
MKLGYVGLGKMGFNMVELLLEKGHQVVVFDKNTRALETISTRGAEPVHSLKSLTSSLARPRLVWIMVPHQAVDPVIAELLPNLHEGDTIIDGGNSPYKESLRRAGEMQDRKIHFLDVGVSGGPSGARSGACLMIGGDKSLFDMYESLFQDISASSGYGYVGPSGAGHFVKMVHNGIEYGMMQALAEGFAVMNASPFDLDLKQIAAIYNHRSVIESRLIGWLAEAFEHSGDGLLDITGTVSHSGEGQWTVEAAKEMGIPVPVIEEALNFRMRSEENPSYTGKVLSALRNQFGGHKVSIKNGKAR